MTSAELTTGLSDARCGAMRMAAILVANLALTACINVKAPDKPIEINLNVNIRQEVIVKLQKDAQDLITTNPELFPQ